MPTEYRLYNSSGCDLGVVDADTLARYIREPEYNILADGDTIKVSKTKGEECEFAGTGICKYQKRA